MTVGLLVHWKSLAAQFVHLNIVSKGEAITKEQLKYVPGRRKKSLKWKLDLSAKGYARIHDHQMSKNY
ncbi:hypothetical protein AV530_007571 [Patagioenas fasciata monilis]|uniref:Uncharacterized protein n=1 Tax=Patagioenas fasciata monilis TaxID=372326 RepID=A0A1V4JYG9_PATFA|nr:hypothetical protein AV530_007571 [Patagioenas fasciata monilis]